jgi:hypothetical protein
MQLVPFHFWPPVQAETHDVPFQTFPDEHRDTQVLPDFVEPGLHVYSHFAAAPHDVATEFGVSAESPVLSPLHNDALAGVVPVHSNGLQIDPFHQLPALHVYSHFDAVQAALTLIAVSLGSSVSSPLHSAEFDGAVPRQTNGLHTLLVLSQPLPAGQAQACAVRLHT